MILGFVTLYLLLSVGIGLAAARRVHTAKDFAVAGRSLPLPIVIATASSTCSPVAPGHHAATWERSLSPGSPHAAHSTSARVTSRPDRCPLIAATTLIEAPGRKLAPLPLRADTFARAHFYARRLAPSTPALRAPPSRL